MKLKGLVDDDFVNYKKCSMFLIFPYCSFKCERECGKRICQNSPLATAPIIEISEDDIVRRFLNDDMEEAIVAGGLEPMDSFDELVSLVTKLREKTYCDFVIYTGYNKEEIEDKIEQLKQFPNIIIKYGRFIPDQPHHNDLVLGVELASPNQYAERIS